MLAFLAAVISSDQQMACLKILLPQPHRDMLPGRLATGHTSTCYKLAHVPWGPLESSPHPRRGLVHSVYVYSGLGAVAFGNDSSPPTALGLEESEQTERVPCCRCLNAATQEVAE